jgi:hypothetical protein
MQVYEKKHKIASPQMLNKVFLIVSLIILIIFAYQFSVSDKHANKLLLFISIALLILAIIFGNKSETDPSDLLGQGNQSFLLGQQAPTAGLTAGYYRLLLQPPRDAERLVVIPQVDAGKNLVGGNVRFSTSGTYGRDQVDIWYWQPSTPGGSQGRLYWFNPNLIDYKAKQVWFLVASGSTVQITPQNGTGVPAEWMVDGARLRHLNTRQFVSVQPNGAITLDQTGSNFRWWPSTS